MSSVIEHIHHVGEPLPAAVTGGGRELSPRAFEEVKAIMRPRPAWFLFTAACAWIAIGLTVWLSVRLGNPFVYVLAVAFIATRQNVLALLVHEQVHKVGINSRLGDRVTNAIAAFWLLLSVEGYRKIHIAHHVHFFTDNDPDFLRKQGEEWEFPQPVFFFLKTLLRDVSGLNLFRFIRGKRAHARPSAPRERNRVAAAFTLLFYGSLAATLTLTGTWRLFLLYWMVPLLTVTQLIVRWGAICEHRYNLVNPSLAESTPLIVLSWWERLLLPNLNFNYHIYHHFFPYISGSNLPRVHAIFKREGLVVGDRVFHGYIAYLTFLFRAPHTPVSAGELAEAAP
ncbi:MAG TPA: fatty acid desaturase, partial [Isosphaeraceae bacterium]|nr:fatty acid desaturase [Isosphaeraceae bacterium]